MLIKKISIAVLILALVQLGFVQFGFAEGSSDNQLEDEGHQITPNLKQPESNLDDFDATDADPSPLEEVNTKLVKSGKMKSSSAEESFSVHENSIFQVRIMNASSKSQSTLGTGFFVGDGAMLATNYHVVSSVVLEPEKYSAEIDIGQDTHHLEVLAIDVIHDLAILSVPTKATPLNLSKNIPARGARLYSIGNPLDIGMTVVEGNYNGLVENRFFDQIHFSGAINSGMSGGPTLDANGDVVGINVASAGNQVGFLVPVDKLSNLLLKVQKEFGQGLKENEKVVAEANTGETAAANDKIEPSNTPSRESSAPLNTPEEIKQIGMDLEDEPKSRFYEDIAQQIQTATHYMINEMLKAPWPLEDLGEARVVGKTHDAIDCWGDSAEDNEKKLKMVQKGCNSRDGFFISRRLSSGYIEYEFSYSQAEDWPVSSFYQRMTQDYAFASPGNRAGKKDVGNFTCVNRILEREPNDIKLNSAQENTEEPLVVEAEGINKKTPFKRKISYCTRPYKKLKGIFDTFYLAVAIEKNDRVVMEHFTLSGVSKEDGERFLNRFIHQVDWK